MSKANRVKAAQLGMSYGAASNRLRKMLLFNFAQRLGLDTCYQCNQKIETLKDFSIEHKAPWLHSNNPIELFFDLDNIAFSHLSCNSASGNGKPPPRVKKHGTHTEYANGCRCARCRKAHADYNRAYRKRNLGL